MKHFAPHLTDFYKTGHIRQYPDGTEYVYSNFTCRSDKWARVLPDFDHKVVFFGLQGALQWLLVDLWNETFFRRPKEEVLSRYKHRMDSSLGVGAVDIKHIEELHDLGYLPIRIKAVPEGSRVNIRVPMFTIINTHPKFYWVTNYLETQISAVIWKSVTSATTAYEFRRLFEKFAKETDGDTVLVPFQGIDFVPWQGHDFSFRGMSGIEDATISGAAHLVSFKGTDTICALDYLEDYYFSAWASVGGSVPATEHSVMCMGGEADEIETIRRLIKKVYPKGVVSIVSDTWDFWQVITQFALTLKSDILDREGKVVFRPDSGDPYKIIVGDKDAPVGTPEYKGAVECLWDIFGGTLTRKNFKTLDSHVGLIYGDSISLELAQRILQGLKDKGFTSTNVVLGIGSYTYQYVTRDTFGSAIKATWGVVNGVARELWKDPKTDNGVKKSARGLIQVVKEGDNFVLRDQQTEFEEEFGELRLVFEDGVLHNRESIHTIRERLLNA